MKNFQIFLTVASFLGLSLMNGTVLCKESRVNDLSSIELAEVILIDDCSIRLTTLNSLYIASGEEERFSILPVMSTTAICAKKYHSAKKYAEDLLKLSEKFPNSWNYGNAIHDANIVFGMISLSEGKVDEAKNFLIKAGQSPGSPQIKNFGPNLMLAKALLEAKEEKIVVEYFQLIKVIWTNNEGHLDRWTYTIKQGGMPDFRDI